MSASTAESVVKVYAVVQKGCTNVTVAAFEVRVESHTSVKYMNIVFYIVLQWTSFLAQHRVSHVLKARCAPVARYVTTILRRVFVLLIT